MVSQPSAPYNATMPYKNPEDKRQARRRWYKQHKDRHIKGCSKNKVRYRKIAREAVAQYLESHPCVDCGESDIVVLEFDHVYGEKRSDIGTMMSSGLSVKSIMDEIAKCDVVCANDHRRRTARRANHFRHTRPGSSIGRAADSKTDRLRVQVPSGSPI